MTFTMILRVLTSGFRASPAAGETFRAPGWTRVERGWVGAVALLFLLTGGLKLQAGWATQSGATQRERVFDMPLAEWSLALGCLELAGSALLLAAPSPRLALRMVRFGFAVILSYRLLLAWHGGGACGCLGTWVGDSVLRGREGVVLSVLAGGCFLVNEVLIWRRRRRESGFRVIPEERMWMEPGNA